MDVSNKYTPPLALTIISSIFIGIGAVFSLCILLDIIWRRGWRTMMLIMIPVYVINALYLWPITIWTYLQYGRPPKLSKFVESMNHAGHDHSHHVTSVVGESDDMHAHPAGHEQSTPTKSEHASEPNHEIIHHTGHKQSAPEESEHGHEMHYTGHEQSAPEDSEDKTDPAHEIALHPEHGYEHECQEPSHQMHGHDLEKVEEHHHDRTRHEAGHGMAGHSDVEAHTAMEHKMEGHGGHDMHHMMMADRPMFATVTIGVCHCGAGCVLGDIVGEWLVYGTNATMNGKNFGPELLVDFAFALAFGIVFQYYSIAPMSGEYGIKTLYRAAKADVLSLFFFEIGLFGWMAIFQIAIWNWRLEMNTVTYWWMMQIGMFFGHWTAVPINYWLISSGIKEPCA